MGKTTCTYCQSSAEGAFIRCLVCPDVELCLVCFSGAAELGSHKSDHAYSVIDDTKSNVSLKNQNWTGNEELMLLDAVEQFGFGNWEDIAAHVKTRSPESCNDHYGAMFIDGSIGQCTLSKDLTCNVIDHTTVGGGPLSPSLRASVPPADVSISDQKSLGFMPLRDDFEREYNNGAEAMISSLRAEVDEDDDLDSEFKITFVDMYRHKIRERFKAHKIARNHDLISNFFTKSKQSKTPKKKIPKQEREIQDSLKPFTKFQTSSEIDAFAVSLKKQKQLRQQVKDLMRYRKNGLVKLDECPRYDEETYLRDKRLRNRRGKPSSSNDISSSVKKETMKNGTDETVENTDSDPGHEFLTDTERRLCASIGLKAQFYITIKTCILKDYLQRRQGVPVKVRYPMGMEKSHRIKIVNFLKDSGWIGASS